MIDLIIPPSWARSPGAEVLSYTSGSHIPPTDYSEDPKDGEPFLTGPSDFINGKVSFKKYSRKAKAFCLPGDILITVKGSGTGSSAVSPIKAGISRQLTAFRPKQANLYTPEFIAYFFRLLQDSLQGAAKGAAIPGITLGDVLNKSFPVPPLKEQERIVRKIESCFEKIEAIENNLNKIEIGLEKLAISFLTRDGEWLESAPLDELTDERLERINQKNPKCRKIGVDNELGVVDLRVTGKQNFEKYKIVKQGDILYNPMRINVGSLALYNDIEDAITSPDYIVFSVRQGFSKWLIFKFLKSSFGAEEISKKLKGAVRERLYYKSLKQIEFSNPSMETHKKAERTIETINDSLISQKENLLTFISKLKESILLKAFEGRLVEQIPSEGTGHELMAKILSGKEPSKTNAVELNTKAIKSITTVKSVSPKGNKNGKK